MRRLRADPCHLRVKVHEPVREQSVGRHRPLVHQAPSARRPPLARRPRRHSGRGGRSRVPRTPTTTRCPAPSPAAATELLERGFTGPGRRHRHRRLAHHRPTVRAADVEQTMTRTLHAIADLPGVGAVTGPYGAEGTGQISEDGRTAYATVTFDQPADEIPGRRPRPSSDTAKGGRGRRAAGRAGRHRRRAHRGARAAHLAEAIGVVVAAVVLFLAFGSLAASLLPIATALVCVGTAYAGIVLLGHVMTVADFAPMLGMLIGLGVGIDYALFIVTRHRRGLRRGLPVAEAAQNAVTTTGRAVVFAGRHRLHRPARHADPAAQLPQRRRDRRLAHRRPHRRRLRHPAARPARPASACGPSAAANAGSSPSTARGPSCPPASPPAGPPSWSATPSCSARIAAVVMTGARPAHPRRSTSAPPTRATTRPPPPPGRRTTCSPTASAPASTARSPSSPSSTAPTTGSPWTRCPTHAARHRGRRLGRARSRTTAAATPPSSPSSPTPRPQSQRDQRAGRPAARRRAAAAPRTAPRWRRHVGGVTAGYDDFAEIIVGKLPLFVGVVIGLGCLLLLLAFRSIGIPLKAAVDERGRRRLLLRRRRRGLPVGLGERAARPRQRRARSSPSSR